jgi:dimeric dUTPase (all-alpha-NTP-PPase superfamily)
MFTKDQMKIMLRLQDSINTKVNLNWIEANNDWMLAAMIECVEAIDHHGWKWWKKQEYDLAQLQMELVDIWHFILSQMIVDNKGDIKQITTYFSESLLSYNIMFDSKLYTPKSNTLLENLKLMSGLFSTGTYNLPLFLTIISQAYLPEKDLFKQYVGKNVLNNFRQDNGYKNGSYVKVWYDGREDNEHLVDILENVYIESKTADVLIYSALQDRYLKNNNN